MANSINLFEIPGLNTLQYGDSALGQVIFLKALSSNGLFIEEGPGDGGSERPSEGQLWPRGTSQG